MATINGIAVSFGFATATDANGNQGFTSASISGVLLQSADQTDDAELEVVRNGAGDSVVHAWYDFKKSCTFEYVVSGASITAAKAATVLPTIGTFLSITACAEMPSLVNTHWEVQKGGKISKSNTTVSKISIPLMACPNITATIT